jgi:predicted lipoprotein with Yx(FWY)xxD motif
MRIGAIATFVVAAVLAGAAAGLATATDSGASVVTAKRSSFGRILFDGRGFALYGFTRDRREKSMCAGACARAWPPYIVKSRPGGTGVVRAGLGTIRRQDGRLQAAYFGHPLYYYVGDRRPGQILCQNVNEFGGIWRVIRPNGSFVR